MKSHLLPVLITLVLGGSVFGDPPARSAKPGKSKDREPLVFVTGSLIPQRVTMRAVGTTTFSPVRIIDRHEIDISGRFTTAGASVNDPAVSIVGR